MSTSTLQGIPSIIEETLSHIAEYDTTRRVMPVFRKRVDELTPKQQTELWDIITQLLRWKRAIVGIKCFNDSWAILHGDMEMPEIQTQGELSE